MFFLDMFGDVCWCWSISLGVEEVVWFLNKGNGMIYDVDFNLLICEYFIFLVVWICLNGI